VASSGNHDNNIYNDNWSERYHGLKEVPADQKKDAVTTTGTDTTKGFGGRGFTGGKKKGPPEDEIEAEIQALLDAFDPGDQQTLGYWEAQSRLLKAKRAALKQAEAEATQPPPPRTAGTPEVKAPPAMKFDIHVPTNAELAANLKGHLLLVHGEVDNNVHPAN